MRTKRIIETLTVVFCILLSACGENTNKGADGAKSESYKKACEDGDFDQAHDSLKTYLQAYRETLAKDGILHKDERKDAEGKYYQAFDYIYKSEIQHILAEFPEEECKDKIAFLLEDIPVEGEKFPSGLCDYDVACRGTWGDEGIPLDAYIIWTQHFNRICNSVLSLAINRKYQDLAKFILTCYVDNVEATKGETLGIIIDGVKVDGNHGYIKYTTTDKDAAKKKYDDAVSSGAFK